MSTTTKPLSVDEVRARYPDWTFHQLSFGLWKHQGGLASVEESRDGWYASLYLGLSAADKDGRIPPRERPRGPFPTPEQALAAADEAGWTIVTQ